MGLESVLRQPPEDQLVIRLHDAAQSSWACTHLSRLGLACDVVIPHIIALCTAAAPNTLRAQTAVRTTRPLASRGESLHLDPTPEPLDQLQVLDKQLADLSDHNLDLNRPRRRAESPHDVVEALEGAPGCGRNGAARSPCM